MYPNILYNNYSQLLYRRMVPSTNLAFGTLSKVNVSLHEKVDGVYNFKIISVLRKCATHGYSSDLTPTPFSA